MKLLAAFISLACSLACVASDRSYVASTIECAADEETAVAAAYDSFLSLLVTREIKKEAFRFPAHLSEGRNNVMIVSRSFYVTPNELRGFEFVVPRQLVIEKDGTLFAKADLQVGHEESKQGIVSLYLEEKRPNQPPEPTALSVTICACAQLAPASTVAHL
jgi:hypothetical protein